MHRGVPLRKGPPLCPLPHSRQVHYPLDPLRLQPLNNEGGPPPSVDQNTIADALCHPPIPNHSNFFPSRPQF